MRIRGTQAEVKPVEIISDKVYLHSNITRIEETGEDGFIGWEYDETELPLEQYVSSIEVLGKQITNLMLGV